MGPVREFVPNVIEPSFGIGRILYSLLEHSYYVRPGADSQRRVLSFPPAVAPIKALVVPLSKSTEFEPFVRELTAALRVRGLASRVDDSSGSIGRRYARNDELGTPFGLTVDFQTLKDQSITLRERDSTRQLRVPSIGAAVDAVADLVHGRKTWAEVAAVFPEFVGQDLD